MYPNYNAGAPRHVLTESNKTQEAENTLSWVTHNPENRQSGLPSVPGTLFLQHAKYFLTIWEITD